MSIVNKAYFSGGCFWCTEAIYKRLKSRAITSGDNEKAIENRMNKYETEMRHRNDYDHVVINDKLETCVDELEKIINNKRRNLID